MQQFQTIVTFECPHCFNTSHGPVEIPEPNWGDAESSSELTSEGDIVIQCSQCDTAFDGYVLNNAGECTVIFHDFPDLKGITASDAHFTPEEWPEPEIPAEPLDFFEDHQSELSAWLQTFAADIDGTALINRLLFASVITGLETYLSDTLRKVVSERQRALMNFLEKDSDLVKQKFTLKEIATRPDLVQETVNQSLKEVLYHNLPKVNALYRISVGVDFMAMLTPEALADLSRAIEYRHHCVHRNGHDLEGNKLTIFTREYITKIQEICRALVRTIDEQLFSAVRMG